MSASYRLNSAQACMAVLAQFHQVGIGPAHWQGRSGGAEPSTAQVLAELAQLGLVGQCRRLPSGELPPRLLPAMVRSSDGYLIVARVEQGQALVHDAVQGCSQVLTLADLQRLCTGELISVHSRASLLGQWAGFDFTWFIPAVIKYRRLLGQTLLAAFFLQVFALVTPLFFQVVMDKVLVHQSLTTLKVLMVCLVVIMLFESVLSAIRHYLLAHTTARIDVELGAQLFQHLVNLPLAYFQARRVGDSVARVRELENIRGFLTGSGLLLVLDLLFCGVFLSVMASFSGLLTLIVLLSLPAYLLLAWRVTPALRERLAHSVTCGAEQQAFLLESINAIDTLKSMALEPKTTQRWDRLLAANVAASFRTQVLSMLASEGIGLIGKLVTVATLWFGARMVIDGAMTVGQLIAFNMLAGRAAEPIQRLAQMWSEFQQTAVSMERLADVLDTRAENTQHGLPSLPTLAGHIQFQGVRFAYRPGEPWVLDGLDLAIQPGQTVGIVGPSGSGKSTLALLLQRLYAPLGGQVFIDGHDLNTIEVSSLRRQIGVVSQDSLLFQRSVRDNIALTDLGASLEEVVAVAKVAGAHEFILALPQGYDTPVGEHGTTLSGGQRQRLAIARALMSNPRLLILDEATSALDFESERVIQQNMKAIGAGRTVIVIAHRLNTVRDADRIVVLEHGRVVEQGTHDTLVGLEAGVYARLLKAQQQ
ncbi:type I secretion system permease/ATPase [Pseudomonas sp. nanlin1]|uniref:type I secretion system permease/ATPase n=1 Tax=Pseudomonas sp. nanlin1 TaxID=3040605 RepID=UPI00388EC31D